jgi:hypothetical protein
MQIDQSPGIAQDAKHYFIASPVQLVKRPDQVVAFTGEALALTRTPFRPFERRAGFGRRAFSFLHDR